MGVRSSCDGFDFSRNPCFGHCGEAFVAVFGDITHCGNGEVMHPVGARVVRVNPCNGVIHDFVINKGKEAGPGTKIGNCGIERPPQLLNELARRGVKPEDVTLVVNTHLHFDHSGGNTRHDGDALVATFPRASYVCQRLEWVDALNANERTRASYFRDDFAPLEAAGKLELIDEAVEILPGIRLDRVQGHTRGTQTVRVSGGKLTAFFSSDFMPDRHHLPLPWIPAQDLFPLDTLEAKRTILARAVEEQWIVAFTHDLPRFGTVSSVDGKYRFTELVEPSS